MFNPPEKYFYLPARLVEQGDRQCGEHEIIGQEDEMLLMFGVEEFHHAESDRITAQRMVSNKYDGLIASEATGAIHSVSIDSSESQIFSCPNDEKGDELSKEVQSFKIYVPSIHDVKGARFGDQGIQNVDIAYLVVGDFDERRNAPAKIYECVQLDSCLAFAESSPGKERKAKVDR